jgi:hypothetical protein
MMTLLEKEKLTISMPCVFCGGQVRAEPRDGENEKERRERAKQLLRGHYQLCMECKELFK